jgi:hypothetical protein
VTSLFLRGLFLIACASRSTVESGHPRVQLIPVSFPRVKWRGLKTDNFLQSVMGKPRGGAECMLAGREGSNAHACCAVTERCTFPTFSIYERLCFARMHAIGLMFLAYRVKFPRSANPTATTTRGLSVVVPKSRRCGALSPLYYVSPCLGCFTFGYFENFSLVSVIQNVF